MRRLLLLQVLAAVLCSYAFPEKTGPKVLPFVPADGAQLDVSPPGFTWWRAGDRDKLTYKVFIYDSAGREVLSSPASVVCAWKPHEIRPEGSYSWTVRAYEKDGKLACEKEFGSFRILPGAAPMPMLDVASLIRSVPSAHPKLLFRQEDIPAIKERLLNEFPQALKEVRANAEKCVGAPCLPDPEFAAMPEGTKEEFARKRIAYKNQFGIYRAWYLSNVSSAAFMYMITGEKRYGEAAKRHLLDLTRFKIGGEGSPVVVYRGNFDEFTMGYTDCLMWSYDWIHSVFTPEERRKMEGWMIELADALSRRLSPQGFDYLCSGTDSHSGRIPPQLILFSLTLSDHAEKAAKWMSQALTLAMTSYPHWASPDGGWAEGVFYSSGYNTRLLAPYEALRRLGGPDLLDMPYFKNYPYFLSYAGSPVGENIPFGDLEDSPMKTHAPGFAGMISFLAAKNRDAGLQWFAGLLRGENSGVHGLDRLREVLCFPVQEEEKPERIPQSRFFKDTGIAAMHTCIEEPEKDLTVLLKSSPFGSVSHSHMDQNSFWIMKGGKSLAIAAGARYPVAGSPFHEEYTRQSMAHNTLLFGGSGQVPKSSVYVGHIGECSDDGTVCYACGKAETAYKGVKRFDRHVALLRPDVILILDDIRQLRDTSVEWLFHAKEKLRIDAPDRFSSCRKGEEMSVRLFATEPLALSQTSEWPVPPRKGYEFTDQKEPAAQWHLTARAEKMKNGRILAVMCVDPATEIRCRRKRDTVEIRIRRPDGSTSKAVCSLAADGKPFEF